MTTCPSPFVIWFTGRSGSTYLCDLLNSHPQIYCRREDFCDKHVDGKRIPDDQIYEINGAPFFRQLHRPGEIVDHPTKSESLEYLRQIYSQDYWACGFKLKHPNQFVVYPEVVAELSSNSGIRLIGLQRDNVLKQAISNNNVRRLREMGVVNSGNSKAVVSLEPLEIDVKKTIAIARYLKRCNAELLKFARHFEHVFYLTYEQIVHSPQESLRKLQEFLGVELSEMSSNFKKVTPDIISDAISNYDELAQAVVGTELEQYLD